MIAVTVRQAKLCLCFALSTLFLCTSGALAQGINGRSAPAGSGLADLEPPAREATPPGSGTLLTVALEGRIEASEYEVGPGDLFTISVGGPQPTVYSQPVSPEGYLVLPEAGSVPVAGRSLAEARILALRALESRFRNVRAEVTLAQPRRFLVHVSGAVPLRGRQEATAVTRLSDLLGGLDRRLRADADSTVQHRPSLRMVQVRRKDGQTLSVDLSRYFATGDTRHNPYLRDGDVITVPAYDPAYESVFVDGNVPFPGRYAYRPGDTVADLLRLAAGSEDVSSLGEVRLTRTGADGTLDAQVMSVQELTAGPVAVQPLDHLFVIPPAQGRGIAAVEGMVAYPGTYPIQPGRTTLRDLVQNRAGGLTPDALPRAALLLRGTDAPPASRADSTALARRSHTAELDFFSRQYLQRELAMQDVLPVDLTQALAEDAPPLYLRDGDRLVVPRNEASVFVFGQVNRPGYVPFSGDRTVEEYIALAGGTSGAARDRWVVKAGTNQFQRAGSAVLESGDAIFVDGDDVAASPVLQQIKLQEQSARNSSRIGALQTALQFASLVASAFTTYILIRQ